MTWPSVAGSTAARSRAARPARTPKSVAERSLRAPPKAPKPVRTPERRTTPVSRGEGMIPKYTSDHGAVPDHGVLGNDHDPIADVVVGTVEKGRLPSRRDPHVVADPGILVDDRPLDPRAVADAHGRGTGDRHPLGAVVIVLPHHQGVPDGVAG